MLCVDEWADGVDECEVGTIKIHQIKTEIGVSISLNKLRIKIYDG